MRVIDRDLIRGGHYGQRSCEPHSKAEHMAAPTNAALVRKALPTRSRPHMALSGHLIHAEPMSAFGGKADILGRALLMVI
jgi:hypothetical protein